MISKPKDIYKIKLLKEQSRRKDKYNEGAKLEEQLGRPLYKSIKKKKFELPNICKLHDNHKRLACVEPYWQLKHLFTLFKVHPRSNIVIWKKHIQIISTNNGSMTCNRLELFGDLHNNSIRWKHCYLGERGFNSYATTMNQWLLTIITKFGDLHNNSTRWGKHGL